MKERNTLEDQKRENTAFLQLGQSLYFLILEGERQISFASPVSGLILVTNLSGHQPATFRLGEHDFPILQGQTITTKITKGMTLYLSRRAKNNCIVVRVLPLDRLPTIHQGAIVEKLKQSSGCHICVHEAIDLSLSHASRLYHLDWAKYQLKIESLLIETLAIQMEQIIQESQHEAVSPMAGHLEKVLAVKKIIDYELSEHHTISLLAKRVGTNEQYLKKHFKTHCGLTINNYITEKRMRLARELILSGEHRIATVANMVGYSHPTHFTHAFKKTFGILPRSLKNGKQELKSE